MQQSGRAKGPPKQTDGIRAKGTVVRLLVGQAYGFIRLKDQREVFFHRADMSEETSFNSLSVGDVVAFELIVDSISGPRAIRVKRSGS
jgi:cold shock CspA family protein